MSVQSIARIQYQHNRAETVWLDTESARAAIEDILEYMEQE